MKGPLALLVLLLMLPLSFADAQELDFRPPVSPADPGALAVMRDLAARVLPVYEEKDTDRYLTYLSAIQLVSGNPGSASATRQALRDRRRGGEMSRAAAEATLYDIYTRARVLEIEGRLPFAQAFAQAFREMVSRMGDRDAYAVTSWRGPQLAVMQEDLRQSFEQRRTRRVIAMPEAIDLIWRYFVFDAYRSFAVHLDALDAEDDRRRYVFEDTSIPVTTGEGDAESIAVTLVRPRNAAKGLTTLLEFTIDVDAGRPLTGPAAHGYAGAVAYARGRHRSSGRAVPFELDGDDARAVIDWIAKQPWSDARVGMYGDGYGGFAAWAAAKRPPAALKAIVASNPVAPGIDFPMSGQVFRNSAYRWALGVTTSKVDDVRYAEGSEWRSLDEAWYASGARYRDLDRMQGQPNRFFQRWLNHPSYDRYWQRMIPYGEEFAAIDIPVLTITGYYSEGVAGALHYFSQHQRFRPQAAHTLLAGPWANEDVLRDRPQPVLRRLGLDPAARVDLTELRWQWFDHVLRGGAKPALLAEQVNFQVMGTNEWRHVASLATMSSETLRFYLDSQEVAGGYLLAQRPTPKPAFVSLSVALAEREDASWTPPADLVTRSIPVRNAVAFVSEPLGRALELDGSLAGRLDVTVNKVDFDLVVTAYELLPNGDYVQLFAPPDLVRASYMRDRLGRQPLVPGKRQELPFRSERLAARRLQQGSRLVIVLGVNKRADQQINYGAGNDVSEESRTDALEPLRIRWHNSGYLDVPVRR